MDSNPRTLSSSWTLFWKCIFPTIMIGGLAAGTVYCFLNAESIRTQNVNQPGPDIKWLMLSVTLMSAIGSWYAVMRLKRVRLGSGQLYVSNYFTEIVVPLSNVAEVSDRSLINIHPLTIRFHTKTGFGLEVVFIPRGKTVSVFSTHPLVTEIRAAVARATTPAHAT